jgi:hypothetical protein
VRLGLTRLVLQLGLDTHRATDVDHERIIARRAARSGGRHQLDQHIGNVAIRIAIYTVRSHIDLHAVVVGGRGRRGRSGQIIVIVVASAMFDRIEQVDQCKGLGDVIGVRSGVLGTAGRTKSDLELGIDLRLHTARAQGVATGQSARATCAILLLPSGELQIRQIGSLTDSNASMHTIHDFALSILLFFAWLMKFSKVFLLRVASRSTGSSVVMVRHSKNISQIFCETHCCWLVLLVSFALRLPLRSLISAVRADGSRFFPTFEMRSPSSFSTLRSFHDTKQC